MRGVQLLVFCVDRSNHPQPHISFLSDTMAGMTFDDLWAHQYCLTCDKQVQVDGAAYCSEACRLAETEKSSIPSSQASSPSFGTNKMPWSTSDNLSSRPSQSKFFLAPAYDFTNAQPYGSTPASQSTFGANYSMAKSSSNARSLTPSSSHASLCSMQSTSSAGDSNHLAEKARKELQAYASTFEQVRMARRRSY